MMLLHTISFYNGDKVVQEVKSHEYVPFVPRKSDSIVIEDQKYYVVGVEVVYEAYKPYEHEQKIQITVYIERSIL